LPRNLKDLLLAAPPGQRANHKALDPACVGVKVAAIDATGQGAVTIAINTTFVLLIIGQQGNRRRFGNAVVLWLCLDKLRSDQQPCRWPSMARPFTPYACRV